MKDNGKHTVARRHGMNFGLPIAAVVGIAWWLLFAWIAGDREAWDSGLYFPGLLILFFLSGVIGRKFPATAILSGATVGIAHGLGALVDLRSRPAEPGFVFWPVLIGFFVLLILATTASACFGRKIRSRNPA